jgi:hypothetical protein
LFALPFDIEGEIDNFGCTAEGMDDWSSTRPLFLIKTSLEKEEGVEENTSSSYDR